ncbi:hypothetical protein HPB50_016361 [Hyalomma asiaticum]|uniref:Uncharacterized protein n=1 Tax=Hyalomma asiaticum TaxID=266040 RepID=A0ACB7SNQ8_HYAAI|nr:hypothetical protein HPB50_016361 [Hyalomma asiaticum]
MCTITGCSAGSESVAQKTNPKPGAELYRPSKVITRERVKISDRAPRSVSAKGDTYRARCRANHDPGIRGRMREICARLLTQTTADKGRDTVQPAERAEERQTVVNDGRILYLVISGKLLR